MVDEPDPRTDRKVLTESQYGSGANLAARASIYRFQRPTFDFVEWVLDQHVWRGSEQVLDVGCGYGAYLGAIRRRARAVTGLDLSMGMLREAADKGSPLLCADVEHLPLPDAAFDLAIAPHMLYHVPHILPALTELRRVVRPGGVVLAVTNASDDKPELMNLLHAAAGRPGHAYSKVNGRFLLEDAPGLLQGSFDHFRVVEVRTQLRVPEVEPLIHYLDSIRSGAEPRLGVDWSAMLEEAAVIAQSEIATKGGFLITTHAGVVVAQ